MCGLSTRTTPTVRAKNDCQGCDSHRVDHEVQPHQVLKLLVVVAHHRAVIARVVEGEVLLHHPVLEFAAVDQRRDLGHLGDHVQDVLVRVLPILLRHVNTLRVATHSH